jgi:hypothetical protein
VSVTYSLIDCWNGFGRQPEVRESFTDCALALWFYHSPSPLIVNLQPYLTLQSSSSWRPYSSQPAAFTPSSQFVLVSQDSPSRAATLIEEKRGEPNAVLQKFGDFDDHLEDVSIDWLRNAACMAVVSWIQYLCQCYRIHVIQKPWGLRDQIDQTSSFKLQQLQGFILLCF